MKRKQNTYGRQTSRPYPSLVEQYESLNSDGRLFTSPRAKLQATQRIPQGVKSGSGRAGNALSDFDIVSSDEEGERLAGGRANGRLSKISSASTRKALPDTKERAEAKTKDMPVEKRRKLSDNSEKDGTTRLKHSQSTGSPIVKQRSADALEQPRSSVPTVHKSASVKPTTSPKTRPIAERSKATPLRKAVTPEPKKTITTSPTKELISRPTTPTRETTSMPSTPRGVMSPHQAKLWTQFFEDGPSGLEPTPMRSLHTRMDTQMQIGSPRRKRLVDALESVTSDPVMSDDVEQVGASPVDEKPVDYEDSSQQFETAFQSQSQVTVAEAKVTYGGNRSYLEDTAKDMDELLKQPLLEPEIAAPMSLQGLGIRTTSKLDVFDMSDEEDDTKAVRSIHELRAAGSHGRFANDLQALLEDLQAGSSGSMRKRLALIDLCKKLLDDNFAARFHQGRHSAAIVAAMTNEDDDFTKAAFCIFLELTTTHKDGSLDDTADAFRALEWCMSRRDSIAAMAKVMQLTRAIQNTARTVDGRILKHETWHGMKELPLNLVAIKVAERLVRLMRERGDIASALLNNTVLSMAVHAAMDEAQAGSRQATLVVETVMSLLESCSLAQQYVEDEGIWSESIVQDIAQLVYNAVDSQEGGQGTSMLALRLVINLTNGSKRNADLLARKPLVMTLIRQSTEQLVSSRDLQVDSTVLLLGALINLTESSQTALDILLDHGRTEVEALTAAVLSNRKKQSEADSMEATQANVAYGYAAVLLGHVCRDARLRAFVTGLMPDAGLHVLAASIEEFVRVHQAADRTEGGDEAYVMFTERMRSVVDNLG